MNLEDKTIILTGARRIGQTVAEELAKKGANLAITYRSSKEESESMCQKCTALGVQAFPFRADLSNENDIQKMVSEVEAKFGRIDVLVHMASPYPKTPLEDVTMEEFLSIQATIGGSALILAKQVIPFMLKNEGDEAGGDPPGNIKGKIIFISDWSVLQRPYFQYHPYNMAKAGINSLTKGLARQFAPFLTVNAVAPGPMSKPDGLSDAENKEALANTPLGRWGGPEPIAISILNLLDNDFMTGQIINVDGGRSVA